MKNTCLLLLVTSFVLGCGANKKNEKGADDKIVVNTKANDGSIPTRPVVPTEVNAKNEKSSGESPRK